MYRVLVVDDEELICQGIKSMIERLGHPEISGVLLAYTAAEARSVIRSSRPDIVITDIQMPGENGLDMIKTLVNESSRIKFVVLSGFDEFRFAREALKLGVLDYLLKPASMQELRNVLDNAASALNLEKQNSSEAREQSYRQLLLENNLRKLFSCRSADDFDVMNTLERLRPSFLHEHYAVGIVRAVCSTGQESCSPTGAAWDSTAGARLKAGNGWQSAEFRNEDGNEVVVLNHDGTLSSRDVVSVMMSAVSAENATIGISGKGEGIESLMQLYRQAEKALSYRLLLGDAAVIEFTGVKDRVVDTAFAEARLTEFVELMKSPNEKRLSDCIDSLFNQEYLSNHSVDCVARLFNGIMRQLTGMAASGRLAAGEDAARSFESFMNLRDIRIYLKETAYRLIKAQKEEDAEKTVMASTMSYIRENMASEISLAVAANRASVSYTHFSRLFKKQTGMNFSEYLMKVRMEEARKLLCNPTLRVYEIASKVGYSDPKHFTRAFRLYFGASPVGCRLAANTQNVTNMR